MWCFRSLKVVKDPKDLIVWVRFSRVFGVLESLSVVAHGRHAAVALGVTLLDLAEVGLIFLHIVSEGEHELLGVFGSHHNAAYHGSLRHAGSCEDEVDDKLVGAVADHCEVGIFAVSHFGFELDLELILVLIVLIVSHCVCYLVEG